MGAVFFEVVKAILAHSGVKNTRNEQKQPQTNEETNQNKQMGKRSSSNNYTTYQQTNLIESTHNKYFYARLSATITLVYVFSFCCPPASGTYACTFWLQEV